MADGAFAVSVLSPEAELLRADARALVLRTSDGDLTILDGHTPIVTDVVPGEVRVERAEGDPIRLAVHGGYLHVETGPGIDGGEGRETRATLLAGIAELAESIDVARAERALAASEARVEELRAATGREQGTPAPSDATGAGTGETPGGPPPTAEELELAQAEAALRRAQVRLEVAGATTASTAG